jgi:hypothetical protein
MDSDEADKILDVIDYLTNPRQHRHEDGEGFRAAALEAACELVDAAQAVTGEAHDDIAMTAEEIRELWPGPQADAFDLARVTYHATSYEGWLAFIRAETARHEYDVDTILPAATLAVGRWRPNCEDYDTALKGIFAELGKGFDSLPGGEVEP